MPMAASADTLGDAMSTAVESNPSLGAAKARLRATREVLPQAWSEALPQISLSAGATRGDFNGDLGDGHSETWNAGADASQLLFASGRILSTTRAARAEIRGAVADYNGTLQDLLLNVTDAYATVLQTEAIVSARQTSVNNLTRLLEYAQAQFDAGVVTRTDVAQSQARLSQAQTNLVQAQGAMAAAVQAYQRLVGHPPADLSAPPEAQGLPADLQSALDTAGRESPVLISAAAAADQADANVGVAASAGRLRLSLAAGHSLSGDFETPNADDTSDQFGLRASLPLFQGGAIRSRTRQQRALRSAANLDHAQAQRLVEEGVTNAWTGLASARASVDSARQQVQASELAYEGVRLEQETGLRSTVEVLNQEQDLLDARLALAQAEHDQVVAERQLLAQIGRLDIPTGSGTGGTAAAPNNDNLRGR
jgi:outer membrane protein